MSIVNRESFYLMAVVAVGQGRPAEAILGIVGLSLINSPAFWRWAEKFWRWAEKIRDLCGLGLKMWRRR